MNRKGPVWAVPLPSYQHSSSVSCIIQEPQGFLVSQVQSQMLATHIWSGEENTGLVGLQQLVSKAGSCVHHLASAWGGPFIRDQRIFIFFFYDHRILRVQERTLEGQARLRASDFVK